MTTRDDKRKLWVAEAKYGDYWLPTRFCQPHDAPKGIAEQLWPYAKAYCEGADDIRIRLRYVPAEEKEP